MSSPPGGELAEQHLGAQLLHAQLRTRVALGQHGYDCRQDVGASVRITSRSTALRQLHAVAIDGGAQVVHQP